MPAVVGITSGGRTSGAATSLTWSHTSTGDVLYVDLGIWDVSIQTVSVTFGGTALRRVADGEAGSRRREVWVLDVPTAGTANIVVTCEAATWIAGLARNVSGVDLDGVIRNFTVASGFSTSPSVTIASAVGDLVLDGCTSSSNGQVWTAGAGQTKDFAHDSDATNNLKIGGSSEAGAASVVMSWSMSLNAAWVTAAYSIPADGTVAGPVALRITQVVAETISEPDPNIGVSQVVIETFASGLPSSSLRATQTVVETFSTVAAMAPSDFHALFVMP